MPYKNPPPCKICGKPTHALNLCAKHYTRWKVHGDTTATLRPDDWGRRNSHPLNQAWRGCVRVADGRVERWNDFYKFLEDVGEKPSENHVLKRLDVRAPWGPDNFFWREPTVIGINTKKQKSEYQKIWRSKNLSRVKGYDLKKCYGINLDDFESMEKAQNGVCAICEGKCGTFGNLSVDHCHETGKVRGLLCSACNRAIGGLKHDVSILERAIAYLKK